MKRNLLAMFYAFLVLLPLAPATSIALPIYYSAHGSATIDGDQLPISGGMYIDDQLMKYDGPVLQPPTGMDNFSFLIGQSSLTIGNSTYAGDSGSIDMIWIRTEPWLVGSCGAFPQYWSIGSYGWGESVVFYNSDGSPVTTPQQPELPQLPELINIGETRIGPGYDLDLWLERETAPAPVPEPATVILLGAGLLGMLGYRKRHAA
jgi:hypothetical protein